MGETMDVILSKQDEPGTFVGGFDNRTGPRSERYWEGRWRDERAENDRLRATIKEMGDQQGETDAERELEIEKLHTALSDAATECQSRGLCMDWMVKHGMATSPCEAKD